MDPLLLLGLAFVIAVCIFLFPYVQKRFTGTDDVQQQGGDNGNDHQGGRDNDPVVVGGGRRARARRNIRRQNDDDEDEDMNNDDDGQESLNIGKIGTKKLKKMQAKAEKKAMREQEEALREDEKKRKESREKERREKEESMVVQEKLEEERALKLKLEQEKKENEEYLKLKESFIVEEEGEVEVTDNDKSLKEFINYIKKNKIVFLEDLAAEFNMKTQNVIDRIQSLQQNHQISGVFDDRGKFIYISVEEMKAVAKFIKQRGRVSITELAQSSNTLVTLQ